MKKLDACIVEYGFYLKLKLEEDTLQLRDEMNLFGLERPDLLDLPLALDQFELGISVKCIDFKGE